MPEISDADLSQNAKALWLKAMSAVQAKNFGYAIRLLQSVLKEEPGFLEGRRILRKCEGMETGGPKKRTNVFGMKTGGGLGTMKLASQVKKDPRAALPIIEAELQQDPYSPELNEILHDAFVALEMPDSAIFALETVRRGHPSESRLMHRLAEYYLSREMGSKAAEVYKDILKHDPLDSAAIKGEKDASARASMQKQKWGEDTDIRDLMKNREEYEEMEKKARSGMTRDQLEARRDELAARYAEDQNDLKTVKDLASTYERLEDWPNAASFYGWAYELSTGDAALRAKFEAMQDRTKTEELKLLEKRAKENPADPEVKALLEERQRERKSERVADAQRRVDQNPTDPVARFELGKALYDAGDFSAAIPHLQQAKRNPHIQSKVLLLLGLTFKEKGMLDMGVKQLETALEDLFAMDGTKKEVLYEKGLLHEAMGDKAAALECFKEIYEVDYGYRDVAPRVESSYGT